MKRTIEIIGYLNKVDKQGDIITDITLSENPIPICRNFNETQVVGYISKDITIKDGKIMVPVNILDDVVISKDEVFRIAGIKLEQKYISKDKKTTSIKAKITGIGLINKAKDIY